MIFSSFAFDSSQQRWVDQERAERVNLERAISIEEFVNRLGDRSLADLRQVRPGGLVDIGPIQVDLPSFGIGDSWRFVRDPADPSKFIDMIHFLAHADMRSSLADETGVLVEVTQLIRRFPSAFTESDILSNSAGEIFGISYYNDPRTPLRDKLIQYFNDLKNRNIVGKPFFSTFPEPNYRFYFLFPDYVTQTKSSFLNPPVSPLVLDLDGDGNAASLFSSITDSWGTTTTDLIINYL